MSAGVLPTPNPCCITCDETTTVQVPGPQGERGAAGTNGTPGQDAFAVTTAAFTMPAVNGTVTASVDNSDWMSDGQYLYTENCGTMRVSSEPNSTSVILINTGASGNVAAGVVVASGAKVSPAGPQGVAGPASVVTLNDISPTTTKGDLIVDNGANSPAASDVRKAVGTNGQMIRALSTDATGISWFAALPNGTATPSDTDNIIPRFNAAAGSETPAPLQKSGMLISDTGAIQSTPTGGNARGVSATDLQVVRSAVTQVASGLQSVIGGGMDNTASGQSSTVGGGESNVSSNVNSFVGGGITNTAAGDASGVVCGNGNSALLDSDFVGGGSGNTANAGSASVCGGGSNSATAVAAFVGAGSANVASASNSSILGGANNTASAQSASVVGGERGVADKFGQIAHAAGRFAANGDAQRFEVVWRIATTNATPAEMFLDGAALRASVGSNHAWVVQAQVVGRRDNGDSAVWKIEGGIKNNAGTTTAIGAFTTTLIGADAGCAGTWGQTANVVMSADNANDALVITVTGSAGNNLRWVASAVCTEVAY